MTLNASGPISLGGSTVGQSINLELGNAATALTSLNASNVRTLLQVPSGQISLSNAYGKSNATAFIVSLGLQNSGSSTVTTVPIRGFGWDCSPSGVTAWKMGAFSYAGYMSADGTTFTSIRYNNASTTTPQCFFIGGQNQYTSASTFPFVMEYMPQINSSANGYNPPATSRLGSNAGLASNPTATACIDSSGNITWTSNSSESKFGSYFFVGRNTASGANIAQLQITNMQAGVSLDSPKRIFRRSDGSFIFVWGTTSYFYYYTFDSGLTGMTGRGYVNFSAGGVCYGFDMDSSNNIYAYFRFGQVLKFSSSNTVTAGYTYSVVAEAYASGFGAQGVFGISIYNDVLYIATNGIYNNAVNASGYALNIIAVSCSNMTTVLWNRQFYFNGNEIRPMSTYQGGYYGQANAIKATSAGLYVAFTVGSGVSGEVFCLNLPLTVGISNQVTTIPFKAGGSVDMTVTTPTNSTSGVSLPGTTTQGTYGSNNPSSVNVSNYGSTTYSPGISGLKTNVPT